MTREAQTKDLLKVCELFKDLAKHLSKIGASIFAEDENDLTAGMLEYLVLAMNDPDSIVLVEEIEGGQVVAALAGSIKQRPKFLRNPFVAEVTLLCPASFQTQSLRVTFDEWAISKGATARTAFCPPQNEVALKAMERDGMTVSSAFLTKPYSE
jgi:hypothetical protein